MRRLATALLSLCLIGGASACSASGGSDRGGSPSPTGGNTGAFLEGLALAKSDTRSGETIAPRPDGTGVTGVMTMDYCDRPFPSEGLRTDRRQLNLMDAAGTRIASGEAVRYETGGARRAVDEMRSAFIECPDGRPVGSSVAGVPARTYDAFPLMEDDLQQVASDHVAARLTMTDAAGKDTVYFVVYQRRGDVMVGTYGHTEDRVLELANAAGKRLAAADGSDVGD